MSCRIFASIALLLMATNVSADAALPRLNILPGSLTVSGVSSGGYMAAQYQVAYAKDVMGAGIIAAGPWFCAQGSLTRALDDCMKGNAPGPDIAPLIAAARASAKAGYIDDPSWLATDRVYVFHGSHDEIVGAAVTDSLIRFYRAFIPPERIHYETSVAAAHGFPADGHGGACGTAASPWINDCDYDGAGRLLKQLYGELREPAGDPKGQLVAFDQDRYESGGMLASLEDSGWLYLPGDCAAGKPCRIHIVFHGCRQGSGFVGATFAREAGYNRWADTNRIVVLYPQAAKSLVWPFNPQGCWDWWGYSGPDYATRNGMQLLAVHRMLQALGAH
jgi:hypothetical protein